MENVREMAGALEALVGWTEDALAGGEWSERWIILQSCQAMLEIAAQGRRAAARDRAA